jgi:hypothetical protein
MKKKWSFGTYWARGKIILQFILRKQGKMF